MFKLTKSIIREIIKEVISEADQKFYARDPKGKKISVFTDKENFKKGVSYINVNNTPRYVDTFNSFIQNIEGKTKPLRNYEHELIVQETLLRATGKIKNQRQD